MSLPLISLLCFLAISLGIGAVALIIRDLASPRQVAAGNSAGSVPIRRRANVFDQPPARSLLGRIDQGFDRLALESGIEWSPAVAFLTLLACGLLIGGGLWLYFDNPLSGIGGALAGMFVLLVMMSIYRARRMRAIREQLPMVLDLLARAVRAGSSVDGAIQLAGEESGGVLGREFRNCSHQLNLGRSLSNVMQSLSARIRLVELRILATTLGVQRQTGGDLAETLERMGGVIRDRLSAQRQMRASTGAGRASALLIATICPIAYVVMFFWQPEHMSVLLNDPMGQVLFLVAIILEVIGILWVFALLRQES